jgi:hypothetical protein
VVRLTVVGQYLGRIVDYVHRPWVISMADSVTVVAHPKLGSPGSTMQALKRIRNSKEAAYKNQPRRRGFLADQGKPSVDAP